MKKLIKKRTLKKRPQPIPPAPSTHTGRSVQDTPGQLLFKFERNRRSKRGRHKKNHRKNSNH